MLRQGGEWGRSTNEQTYLITNLGLRGRGKGSDGGGNHKTHVGLLTSCKPHCSPALGLNVPILQMSILRPSKLKQGLRSHRALVAVGTGPGWETSGGVASGLTSSSALGPFGLVLCREHWAPSGTGRGGSLLWAWVSPPACDSLLPGAPLEALEGH